MQLHFKKYGETGEALIILHGFLGSLDNWHSLAIEFGKKYRVFSLDLRNHGKSPHTEFHSINLMVDDLNAFMQQQNISSAFILGHSMGAKVAMQFATKFPEKTIKLIAVDMSPRQYQRGHDNVIEVLNTLELQKIKSRKHADEIISAKIPELALRQFLLKNLVRTELGFKWKINLLVLERDYTEIVKACVFKTQFTKPTLFIKGENSNYILADDEKIIHSHFSDVKIIPISNAGHWVHADNPREFLNAVLNFLR